MNFKLCFTILFATFIMISCRKIPATPLSEQELITTLQLHFIDTADANNNYTFSFTDIDGDGGIAPTIDTIILPKNKTFYVHLLLIDERDYPADTINAEILDLDTEHQFFFKSNPSNLISFLKYLDEDIDGNPIGLSDLVNTDNTVSTGIFNIILRHLPNKTAINVAQGDITNANGETDIEVDFPVRLY